MMLWDSPGLWKQMRRKISLFGGSEICRQEQEWWTHTCSPKGHWFAGLWAAFMHRVWLVYIYVYMPITLDVNTSQPGKCTELQLSQCALQHPLSILEHKQQGLSYPFLLHPIFRILWIRSHLQPKSESETLQQEKIIPKAIRSIYWLCSQQRSGCCSRASPMLTTGAANVWFIPEEWTGQSKIMPDTLLALLPMPSNAHKKRDLSASPKSSKTYQHLPEKGG